MMMYKLLFNLEMNQYKNGIKNIITNPKRLITYIIYFVFMIFIVVFNTKNLDSRSTESIAQFIKYFSSGSLVLTSFIVYSMLKKSNLSFHMSDINLLFTAPVDSKKILLFNLIKRIPMYLIISAYTLLFILSTILGSIDSSLGGVVFTCIGYALIFLIVEPISFMIFVLSVKLKKENLQQKITQVVFVLLIGILIYTIYDAYSIYGFSVKALLEGLNSNILDYIPILGWGRYLILSALIGISVKSYVFLTLMVVTYFVLVIVTYNLADDYYEDVIQSSENMHKMKKSIANGKRNQFNFSLNRKNVSLKGDKEYAEALDWKRKLLIKRKDISIYFSVETIIVLAGLIGVRIAFGSEFVEAGLFVVAGGYIYLKFLFSSSTNIDDEISKPYFFLIPDKSRKKVIQLLKTDIERIFVNGVIMVITHSLLNMTFRIEWILFPIALTLVLSLFLFSGILVSLFLPNGDAKKFYLMLKMLQIIVLLLPSIIVSFVVGILSESILLTLISNVAINSIMIIILLSFSEKIINRMELK